MQEELEKMMKEIREMIQDRLMLSCEPEDIDVDALIFEVEGIDEEHKNLPNLGLDSVDGLEIMVGIKNLYNVKLDAEKEPQAYKSVRTLAEAVYNHLHEKECEG
ncbi:acyl carrier protein [Ruminiclostridium josui]|uniref:acyl carrier protein n=1 Tax=Ruminiclostridium josui TaxID=1499 RepID=UPI000463421E|nr:phosphopantetheine-binding protein [Ruminiclostridium josui]